MSAGHGHGASGFVVTPGTRRATDDTCRCTAVLTRPGAEDLELWFEVPGERAEHLTSRADPWLLAVVHAAMARGRPLHVAGPVHGTLLAHLEEYQAAFAAWADRDRWPNSPRYHHVAITADEVADDPAPAAPTICAFSGGVDSTFTLGRHARGEAGAATRPIGAALMVAGFDIPVADRAVFDRAVTRARHITDDLGVELLTARTNLRELDLVWPDVFAGAVAAGLSLFGAGFGAGMLSTGRRWSWIDLPDDGSSPAWDWLLGSSAFEIVHDGAGFDRPDKVAALADWEAARRNVRVCWAGAQLDRNCGRCRKCIGTYLLFRCLAIPPDCFDEVPADDELATLVAVRRPGWTIAARYADSLLATARAQGVDEPWVRALARSRRRDRVLDETDRLAQRARARRARS